MDDQDTKDIVINPYYAINISSSLSGDHDLMVSEEKWIKVNLQLMKELGNEEWLKQLLRILKTDVKSSGHTEQPNQS